MLDDLSGLPEELTQAPEALCLGESNFEVNPSQIIFEIADKQKLKFNLIQWLAESPNRTIKSQRKQAITNTLSISARQVERLLNQDHRDELLETTGMQRSDKGKHRISEYWQEFVKTAYEKSLKDKHPMTPADVMREVQRHAVMICGMKRVTGPIPQPFTEF